MTKSHQILPISQSDMAKGGIPKTLPRIENSLKSL